MLARHRLDSIPNSSPWKNAARQGVPVLILALILGLMPTAALAQQAEDDPDQACLACHGEASLADDPETRRLLVDQSVLADSVHSFFSCTDCHQDLAGQDPFGHDSALAKVDCGICHPDAQQVFSESLHFYALERGNPRAPDCAGCHGAHNIFSASDQRSTAYRANVPEMCASCHGQAGLLTEQLVKLPETVLSYARSVHGRALQREVDTAATCIDCHGVHDLAGRADPESRIHPLNISATCGRCHSEAKDQYERSIHGRALQIGIWESPTCTNCHGEHLIMSPQDPEAATSVDHVASDTCGHCHQDSRITEKYGLANYVVNTYVDSYHGWARLLDSEEAADCVSCHTAHRVLPARDPESTVHPQNVSATCQQCHPESDDAFAASYTHRTASVDAHPVTRGIGWVYWVLIPVVIGAMLAHNGLILVHYLVEKRRAERAEGEVLRLDRTQLVQHLLLGLSFIGLVITGFALRHPDAWWVSALSTLGMDEAARSSLHRLLAIVLIGVGLSHFIYVTASQRGRREFRSLIPRRKDLTDLRQTILLHLSMGRKRVAYGRHDYTQKLEYWAMVWGSAIMALSGFVLWYPSEAVKVFPTWIVEAAQAIHYYEAWLAALAVVVWHFFFVLFHPEVYPMSWTVLTGKMTRREVRKKHPEWYREEFATEGERGEQKSHSGTGEKKPGEAEA